MTVDYQSRGWQHGYWVGRGELDIRDAIHTGSDESFNDGVSVGAAEYGVVFGSGGLTHGSYEPTFHSVEELEAGTVVRIDPEWEEDRLRILKGNVAASIPPATKQTPRAAQAYRIERILNEPTKSALIGD